MLNKILDILFPKKCLGCNRANTYFCPFCFNEIEIYKNNYCFLCGKPTNQANICCNNLINKIIVAVEYKDPIIRKIIKNFKYKYIKELKIPLSKFLIASLENIEKPIDYIIIPIPLHKKRQRQRGFNQSELLAQEISKHFNIPIYNVLKRNINTQAQANIKDTEKRKENIKDAFEIQNKELIKNKNIILIDDVATTGATLLEASKILKQNQANKIYGLVVAKG